MAKGNRRQAGSLPHVQDSAADDFAFEHGLNLGFQVVEADGGGELVEAVEPPFVAELAPDFETAVVGQERGADAGERDAAEDERMDG